MSNSDNDFVAFHFIKAAENNLGKVPMGSGKGGGGVLILFYLPVGVFPEN